MKFRKKPVIIEAEQYFEGKKIDGLEENWDNNPMTPGKVTIETLEGHMHVSEGDWIITGVKGEKYPCKPDIFEATYESAEVKTATEIIEEYKAELKTAYDETPPLAENVQFCRNTNAKITALNEVLKRIAD